MYKFLGYVVRDVNKTVVHFSTNKKDAEAHRDRFGPMTHHITMVYEFTPTPYTEPKNGAEPEGDYIEP